MEESSQERNPAFKCFDSCSRVRLGSLRKRSGNISADGRRSFQQFAETRHRRKNHGLRSAFIELAHRNKWGLVTSDERQRDISKKRFVPIDVEYIK